MPRRPLAERVALESVLDRIRRLDGDAYDSLVEAMLDVADTESDALRNSDAGHIFVQQGRALMALELAERVRDSKKILESAQAILDRPQGKPQNTARGR